MHRWRRCAPSAVPNDEELHPHSVSGSILGSYVGNRQDAIEALSFVAQGKVSPQISIEPLKNLELVYHRMESGQISGRIVL